MNQVPKINEGGEMKMQNVNWKSRPVKSAGHVELRVVSLRSNCGTIKNGIAFAFEGEGGWVVDFNDLKSIVKAAEKLRPQQ